YVMYEYPFNAAFTSGWPEGKLGPTGGLMAPAKRQEFAVGVTGYRIPSSVKNSSGGKQNSNMQLVGARWSSYIDNHWYMLVSGDGAFGGDSAGYMQLLGGLGYRFALGE